MGRKAAPPPPPAEDGSNPAPPPKKKKGRPSLLDLQKRALTLQQELPTNSAGPVRRSTRRNPLPSPPRTPPSSSDDDNPGKRRREKKLKLVFENGADRGLEDPADGLERTERPNSASLAKVMGGIAQGEPSDSGPTTPLPDKKTLLLILDRLQKKDKYGVYADPVDPEELPDYHEIIEHPMDFSTVRKKLSDGAYTNLELFEKDVFLISSNAMQYNAPDTIYFRQARSIEELAKKSFENLRQGKEENEPEPEVKVVRRGRPPGKSSAKKPVGRPSAEPVVMDSSPVDVTPVTTTKSTSWVGSSSDLLRKKASMPNMLGFMTPNQVSQVPYRSDNCFQWADNRLFRNEESSGLMQRVSSTKLAKKIPVSEDNRRSTYLQPLPSNSGDVNSILSTFHGERKQLVPIGVFLENAYARSLARFAANLGPIGWEIAAKRIEKSLPPGTPFGRGWVGDNESSNLDQNQNQAPSTLPDDPSATSVKPDVSATEATPRIAEQQPDSSLTRVPLNSSQGNNVDGLQSTPIVQQKDGGQANSRLQHLQKMNGFNRFYFDLSQVSNLPMQASAVRDLHQEVTMTHGQLLDMVSRTNNVGLPPASAAYMEEERPMFVNSICTSSSDHPVYPVPDVRVPNMGNADMHTPGVDTNYPAMRTEWVNSSTAASANSARGPMHPPVMGSSNSQILRNLGISHGFGVNHSALSNYSAAESSVPGDSHDNIPCNREGVPFLKNIETSNAMLINSNNRMHMNQIPVKENPVNSNAQNSGNALSDSGQPVVHPSKVDSICPDLNSVFQGGNSQIRSTVSQKSDLALQL